MCSLRAVALRATAAPGGGDALMDGPIYHSQPKTTLGHYISPTGHVPSLMLHGASWS